MESIFGDFSLDLTLSKIIYINNLKLLLRLVFFQHHQLF